MSIKTLNKLLAELDQKSESNPSEMITQAKSALLHPETFMFRAFNRSFEVKQRYRAIGLRYDEDVLDPNLEKIGAEYSPLWCKYPFFNFSRGKVSTAILYFCPLYHFDYANDQQPEPQDILDSTASSYLTIYHLRGIESANNFFSIRIIDGEPLARKRICTIRVDWQLPQGVSLPPSYGR